MDGEIPSLGFDTGVRRCPGKVGVRDGKWEQERMEREEREEFCHLFHSMEGNL